MPLIKSISGIRGTIGGSVGTNLTPIDIVYCASAYGQWILGQSDHAKVVIGRDARISGSLVNQLVTNTLLGLGIDVIDLGLSTTPTVEKAVVWEQASGGIVLTASHNPKEWNALKFLNQHGEFISSKTGKEIIDTIENQSFTFANIDQLGQYEEKNGYLQKHIDHCLQLPHVNAKEIRDVSYKIAVDSINSTGSISIVPMLKQLGCQVVEINNDLSGEFAHNPEPLPTHLKELASLVVEERCDLGISVDPDVDRLAFVSEDGSMFGEEYTIVALADHILSKEKGNTVSNLSSTQALKVVTEKHGGIYHASAVGEVNVVTKMKEVNAIFGGEGNGGVIYPASHYGRDALVGVALFLTMLAERKTTARELRATLPDFTICKLKVELKDGMKPEAVLEEMKTRYSDTHKDTVDGLKLIYDKEWVHMRKSNTEPIIRIYAESTDQAQAESLAQKFCEEIRTL